MKKILLACNDGMSTSFLTNKMNAYVSEQGLPYEVRAVSETAIDREWEDSDVILLGPQVGYLKDSITERIGGARPVDVLNPIDYGRVNAKGAVEQAMRLLGDL